MRKTSLAMVCSCLLWCCALASVSSGSTGVGDPIGQSGNGRLIVAVHSAGGWVEVGDPAFGKHPVGWMFDLSNHEISVPVCVKVSHDGPTAAHIDSLLVDGRGPVEIQGASEDALLAVIKAGKTNHDLIDVRGRTLIFVFDAVSDAGRLNLTARIEPVRISKVPFHYPPDNHYGKVDETSTFYPYAFDSHRGRLEVDGSLEGEGLGEPFFEAYSKTGTGHPSDFTYGWIRNDDENLYVALDFVPDNTMDGAADYARVYVNTPSGVRRYEVSVPDQRWGMPGFSYTSRAAYQHKVYEFKIPLDEFGVHPQSTALPLELAFAAYGTAAPTTVDIQVSKIESIDPVVAGSAAGNLVYVVTVFNDGPADVTGLTISEDLTLPAGVTRDSAVPSAGSFVDTTAPDGTWTLDLADQAIATLTMTLTVDPSVAFGTDVISNTATVTGTGGGETLINPGDDSATESTSVAREVDLVVSKTESIDPVTAGSGAGNLTYVVTVTNQGPSDASGVTLSEVMTLPSGVSIDSIVPSGGTTFADPTWTIGDLVDGASETLTVTLTVSGSTAGGTDIISNTATVTAANETLTNSGDDSATESTSVAREVDLVVSKTESIDPVTAGSGAGNLTYVVTVTNQGPSDASGVTLSEVMTLPSGVSIDSIVPSGGTTFADPTWTIGDLVDGASETLTVTLTVSGSTAGGTDIISNTATVTAANETLTNSGDDSATESTSVLGIDDFGDAPDSYGTLLASNGARHSLGAGLSLGSVVDGEADGQPTAAADGDDLNPLSAPDDEDGVNLPAVLYAGVSASVVLDGGPSGGMLDSWVDFNGDGDFSDAGEQLWGGGSQVLAPGSSNLSFTVPAAAVPGSTYARFRLSSAGGLTATGAAPDGEVEDYRVQIALPVGTIIIEKQTDPDGSPQSFEFSSDYGPNFTLSDGATNNSGSLAAGTYSVSEINIAAGWNLMSATCDDGSAPSAIALGSGETVTCTFNNSQAIGTIIIEKQTDPDGSSQSFEFSSDYGPNFTLSDGATNNSGPLTPGTYSVSEVNLPASWNLTSATCDDGSNPSAIALGSGETVTCTFDNAQAIGTIIIEKQTDPDGSPQSFEFSSDYGPNFTLSDGATNNSGPLAAGTYSVSEINIAADWNLMSATCDDGSSPSAIALSSGETVTCVFNNSALDTDGDGIVDSDEGPPSEDRDGDGVPNYLDFDPSGYFYDEVTGEIFSGGSISISGPGVITVLDDGSATGQYSWIHDGTQGDYTMTVTYPSGWAASAACLDLGILNPGATPDPLNLGAGENGSTGFLTSWDCGTNSFYTVLRVDATNPANIINNNISMMAVATAIPALGDRGVMVLVLLLLVAGTLILRRNF